MDKDYGYLSSLIDKSETSPIAHLKKLNEKYKNFSPSEKSKAVDKHIDRGNSVTNALKKLLGAQCQICGWNGFKRKGKENYIETHHLTQIFMGKKNSLCSDNIILLCPDCHREIHNGSDMKILMTLSPKVEPGIIYMRIVITLHARSKVNSTKNVHCGTDYPQVSRGRGTAYTRPIGSTSFSSDWSYGADLLSLA